MVVSVYLGHQGLETRLGQHDRVREGGKLVHGQVLLVHQLGPGDGRHPGEELVPWAVPSAVLDGLEVANRGEELGGMLVSKRGGRGASRFIGSRRGLSPSLPAP